VPAADVLPADVLATGIFHCHLVPQNRSWLRTLLSLFPSPFPNSSHRKFQNKLTGLWLFILYRRLASQWCQGRVLIINLAVEAAPQSLLHVLRRSSEPSVYIKHEGSRFLCLRVIGNHPRRTRNSHLHYNLNIEPIPILFHLLTVKFFAHCPSHTKPPVQQVGNCSLADMTNLYKPYEHKRTKHILLQLAYRKSLCFLFIIFHYTYIYIHIIQIHLYHSVNISCKLLTYLLHGAESFLSS